MSAETAAGPNGMEEYYGDYPFGLLMAKVGENIEGVGSVSEILIPEDGELKMMGNDALNGLYNNSGEVEVTITIMN